VKQLREVEEVVAGGVRCICFCQCGGWVLRMFPLVRVECLLCCDNVCSCESPVLRHGAEYGTHVEEFILQAFAFFVVWFCLPFAFEGCVREYLLRACLINICLLLCRHLLVVCLFLLVNLAHVDEG